MRLLSGFAGEVGAPGRSKEYQSAWRAKNLEKRRESDRLAKRRRRAKDPERVREKQREWLKANPEKYELIKARSRKRYAENREKIKAQIRARRTQLKKDPLWREHKKHIDRMSALKNRYGLSIEQAQHLDNFHKGRCAICAKKTDSNLFVDHSHFSGKVRGLLCPPCNTGLGWLEMFEWRQKAETYLKEREIGFFEWAPMETAWLVNSV